MLTSWDEFQNVFGGFIAQPPTSYLAPAVYGFFLNQGTNCYIVRAGTGVMAFADLLTRQASPQTDLVATAIAEGIIGNSISAQVIDSSRLASMLQAVSTWSISALTATSPVQATTATPNTLVTGQTITITGTSSFTGVAAGNFTITVINPTTFTLNGTSGSVTYVNGSFTATADPVVTTLAAAQAQSNIVGFDATGTLLTLVSNTGFVAGDRIQLSNGATEVTAVVKSTQGTAIVVLLAPVPAATATALASGTARTADLFPGQLTFRVTVPNGLVLSQALLAGALISVTLGATTENVTVASSGGNTITLATALVNGYSMAGPTLPQIASLEFDLVVTAATTETWPQLSMNPLHPDYWKSVVNSQLITLSLPPSPPTGTLPDPRPADAVYNLAFGNDDDRAAALADVIANPNTYLDTLKPLQDVDIVAIPGVTDPNPQQALFTHCETLFNRFAILDAAPDSSVGFSNLRAQYAQVRTPNGFAAIYFPWIQVVNPLTGVTEYWPPSGHVMGIYAQTDQTQGVYKAPANVPIAGALGLQSLLSNADQGPLNLLGINILRVFPEQSQPLVWGARTTSTDSDWQYINVRRLFIYLEQSIEQGIRWAIFQPNNPMLWGKLNRTITEFLNRVEADGGIIDFYVRIDSALNPPATQALGQLFIEVGIQPAYPAEFIILRIGIWQGGSSVTES